MVSRFCVCVGVCVLYGTFINGLLAQSKTYTSVYAFCLGKFISGLSLDTAFRCGRINAWI